MPLPVCPIDPATRARHSACANALLALDRPEDAMYEDMHVMHAPSECGDLVEAWVRKDREAILQAHGFEDEEAFRAVTRLRCRPTYGLHLLGLV